MNIISNSNNYKLSVGIDIGSSKICCAIGQANNADTRIKLLGLASYTENINKILIFQPFILQSNPLYF